LPSSIRTDAFLLYTQALLPQADHIALYELELYEPSASAASRDAVPFDAGELPYPYSFSADDRFGRWRGGAIGDVPHLDLTLPDWSVDESLTGFDLGAMPDGLRVPPAAWSFRGEGARGAGFAAPPSELALPAAPQVPFAVPAPPDEHR